MDTGTGIHLWDYDTESVPVITSNSKKYRYRNRTGNETIQVPVYNYL
jgi:hypothetical protein